jgi:hypothetical protein
MRVFGLALLIAKCGAAAPEPPAAPCVVAPGASSSGFPSPDAATLSWLSARVQGLDADGVRAIPLAAADAFLADAVAAKATDLDLFSNLALRGGAVTYYLSSDVLESLNRKYTAGILPVSGTTEDGRPFQMKAVLAGGGRLTFLYDQDRQFSFKDGGDSVKITGSGNVFAQILGPADISYQNYNGCGCKLIFCGCAVIQRMTKASEGKMSVQTSRGPQTEDLLPITFR